MAPLAGHLLRSVYLPTEIRNILTFINEYFSLLHTKIHAVILQQLHFFSVTWVPEMKDYGTNNDFQL